MGYDRLSGLDTAFLCLDSRSAPMNLGALTIFAPSQAVHPTRLVELLRDRAGRIPRLRQRARSMLMPLGAVQWVPDPDFDVSRHVHAHHLPRPHDPNQLTEKVSELISRRLELDRPLWELHVLTGLPGGRFALLAKLHHALADGAGAVMIGLGLMDGFTRPPVTEIPEPSTVGSNTFDLALDMARRALGSVRPVNGTVPALDRLPAKARQVQESFGIAASVMRGARPPAVASPLLATPSPDRQLATLRIGLDAIKEVRAQHGGTNNDVLLALLSGALRDWLLRRGEPVDGRTVRTLVPVNSRGRADGRTGGQPDGRAGAGNQLSGYLCDLPVGEPDPVRRLVLVREAMDRNKEAGTRQGAGALPMLAERVPAALHRVAMPLMSGGAAFLFDTVATNVQLPRVSLAFDGAALQEIYPVVPLAAGHALAVAFCGYGDAVHVGLCGNADALPDLHTIADGFDGALADLRELCAQSA
ncbi:MAG TPA: wax ester/triacylglycerol synthase family O-acyltransferase [Pseudonocardiaceae bacterium]|jgi:WS/DGAT/MGAT family acyltransferase|nr:wax ester/triacylglycerol synthase family O-acyltransferase [Pseudonocardiaceae bacterium]